MYGFYLHSNISSYQEYFFIILLVSDEQKKILLKFLVLLQLW